MPFPEIEKFMPLWVCGAIVLLGIVAFIAISIVLITNGRRRDEE